MFPAESCRSRRADCWPGWAERSCAALGDGLAREIAPRVIAVAASAQHHLRIAGSSKWHVPSLPIRKW